MDHYAFNSQPKKKFQAKKADWRSDHQTPLQRSTSVNEIPKYQASIFQEYPGKKSFSMSLYMS